MFLLCAFFLASLVRGAEIVGSAKENGVPGNQLNKDKDKDNNKTIIIVCSSVAALILLVILIYVIWCCLKPCKGTEEVNTTPLLVSINMADKKGTIPERDPIKPLEARDDSEKFIDPALDKKFAKKKEEEEEELQEPEANEEPIVTERSLPPVEGQLIDTTPIQPQEEKPQEPQVQPEPEPKQEEIQPEPQPQEPEPQHEEPQPKQEEPAENHEEGDAEEEEYEDDPENPGQKRKKLEHHNRKKGEHMYLAPLPTRKKKQGWTVEVEGTLLL